MIRKRFLSIHVMKRALAILLVFVVAPQVYSAAQGKYDSVEGKYLDPQVKTNINKIDPLFEEKIEDYRGFDNGLHEQKKQIANGVERGVGTKDVVGADEADKTADSLSRLNANELESAGRIKGGEEAWLNEMFVDYSKPGNMMIKKDMEEIANNSGSMMEVLYGHLKDLGVDCKSVKGNSIIEPQYYINLKNRTDRDKGETIYDQYFCEQPRREYSCLNEVRLTCIRKGMRWGDWQDKQINVPGRELIGFGHHMFSIVKPRDKVFDYYLKLGAKDIKFFDSIIHFTPDPSHIHAAKLFLATKHVNATIDNIGDQMSSSSEGDHFSISGVKYCGRVLGSKDYAFETYTINYKYRDGSLGCLEWQEDWSEECRLQ